MDKLFLQKQKLLWKQGGPELDTRQLLVWGALIGAIFFLLVYGISSLNVTDDAWVLHGHVESDITCDYSGWIQYRNAPWSWPLGVNKNIGYPYGNAIVVSGPIAPLGLLLKALSPILPETFQYYGWWMLLCYVLQGMSAALLTGLFTRRVITVSAATLLFTASPVLAERAFRHCSLCIHFEILLAFYLYIRASRGDRTGQWWKYTVLSSIAVMVFPYFYPIIIGIMAASLLQAIPQKGWVRRLAGYFAANTIIPLLCGYGMGLFYAKNSPARDGYGIFSMNLNQILNAKSYGDITWSRVLGERPLVLAQYDGFNYLGLGILIAVPILAVAGIVHLRKRLFSSLWKKGKQHFWLALVLAGFVVYALSNAVYWDDTLLVSYHLPSIAGIVTGLFRSSSRIFYGTYYFIFLIVIVGILRLCRKHTGVAALLVALLVSVQIWDISPGLAWKNAFFSQTYHEENQYDTALMEYAGQHYDRLIFLDIDDYNAQNLSVEIGKQGLVTNLNTSPLENIYGSEEYAQKKLAQLRAGDVDDTEAYVIMREAVFMELSEKLEGKAIAVSDENFNMLLPIVSDDNPPESKPMVRDK